MIEVRNLTVITSEGKRLLDSFTLDAPEKSVIGVFGPNGSGKSTFLKALAGVDSPHEIRGEVRIEGQPIRGSKGARERVSRALYLGSDFKTTFGLTVRELFELGVKAHDPGMSPLLNERDLERIGNVVATLEISDFLGRTFPSLSDGEKQLMMFARALIQAPKVVILDETFSKLDLDRLIQVSKLMRAWVDCGMTFLVASHDLNFLTEISDQLLFVKSGRIVTQGSVDEVLSESRLRELFTRALPQVVKSPVSGRRKILY